MIVAVTGANGYIGQEVIKQLSKKEGIKILRRLGFNKKIIDAFIGNIYRLEDEEDQVMKEIIMCKVPKKLLN